MAERVGLIFLQNLCRRIQALHRPGARITICSDGHVFSDVVRVGDEHITAYGREISAMIDDIGAGSLDVFNLADEFGDIGYGQMRDALVENYALSIEEIRDRIATDATMFNMFNGVHRFLFEDLCALEPDKTRTQLRKLAKADAYHVILRSDAWSRLIEQRFPRAVRLSIHPQPPHHRKIGIHFLETFDNWLTPWHSAAVRAEGRFVLMKRYHAERVGATLVYVAGRPSHFVVERLNLAMIQPARRHADPVEV
jgi:pyoverdine/dityrosine biosynthesis protein Dit1